jgi:prenylcysteine alpha-carboxyl methylesterase
MCSETYADVLKKAGAKAKLQLYKGKTHTDVFVQVSYPEYQLYIL